jgi:hypothetical protein
MVSTVFNSILQVLKMTARESGSVDASTRSIVEQWTWTDAAESILHITFARITRSPHDSHSGM